ncbi:MAG TPA: hypothetical protein VEX43_08785 [Chthoniobacterales bacterium]|nr:hypothetical protein [Chthoniobacterales bacterium]
MSSKRRKGNSPKGAQASASKKAASRYGRAGRVRVWDDTLLKELEAAQKALEKRYLGKKGLLHRKTSTAELAENVRENVIGVGIGEKRRNNLPQGELCLTIFVRKKLTPGRVADGQQLPAKFRKFVVDVEEMGDIRPAPVTGDAVTLLPSQVVRPLQPGCSVGVVGANAQPIAGTFGALVRKGNELFILSNNHVLADENRLALGAPVFQPSPMDSSAQVPVATLATVIPLQTGSPNLMDAAIARLPAGAGVRPEIFNLRAPSATGAPTLHLPVEKFGRSTNYRAGVISNPNIGIDLPYGIGTLTFRNQVVIRSEPGSRFATDGDSGALILQRGTNVAIGLLHSCNGTYAIASPIAAVLKELGVTFA